MPNRWSAWWSWLPEAAGDRWWRVNHFTGKSFLFTGWSLGRLCFGDRREAFSSWFLYYEAPCCKAGCAIAKVR